MVKSNPRLSTGIAGLDEILQMILPGDNLVWQINSMEEYRPFARAFADEAVRQGKRLVYFRFARHEALLPESSDYQVKDIDPNLGFETFTIEIRRVIQRERDDAWYLFDCLSDLPAYWFSDLMLGNFFVLICPYILSMKGLAYFALLLNRHSLSVASQIRKTTQILIDIYSCQGDLYIQPLKVEDRRSPTMYLPHRITDGQLVPVTDSASIARIVSILENGDIGNTSRVFDIWERTFLSAQRMLDESRRSELPGEVIGLIFKKLLNMVMSQDAHILEMAEKYLTMEDVLQVKRRLIGSGRIGGKAVGMLLARAIVYQSDPRWRELLEIHDSFYIGSDVYYTYIVENNCWEERQRQRDEHAFLNNLEEAQGKIFEGKFPGYIIDQFVEMLDYFGQSPIIIRSSSLLEDNFGNAFSGKYESVFCANQGTREERLEAFVHAVKQVYASTMSREALAYRSQRRLLERDEQMALLIQRVSGSVHGTMFMPHVAGVGYSFNPYAWSPLIDPRAGVLRIVCGLGTRAVDRRDDDYTRVVALNAPNLLPEKSLNAYLRFSQSHVDILDLHENDLRTVNFDRVAESGKDFPLPMVASRVENGGDYSGMHGGYNPWILTFEELLSETRFAADMRELLQALQSVYHSPVDIEFTVNFRKSNGYRINLLQCRPLQATVNGETVKPPRNVRKKNRLFDIHGAIIGSSKVLRIDQIIYVVPETYGKLPEKQRYEVARLIGRLMHLPGSSAKNIMLMGPGRWGTSMPSLGIPVNFADINTVSVLCEMVEMSASMVPDVSLGTHFFNDIVESDITYIAIFPQVIENFLNRDYFDREPNQLAEVVPAEAHYADLVRIIETKPPLKSRIMLYADSIGQQAFCHLQDVGEPSEP